MNWTHEKVKLTDIRRSVRKRNKNFKDGEKYKNKEYDILYVITIESEEIKTPLFISEKIFEDRVESYFLQDMSKITREQILNVRWNFLITKGHYVKINRDGTVDEVPSNPNKYYISYLEIDGPLGTLQQAKIVEEDDEFSKL